MNRLKYLIGTLLSLGLLAAALSFLYKVSRRYRYEDIVSHLHNLPFSQVLIAIGLTACSYGLLTFYDKLAVNYVGHKLPYRRIGLASFIGYTFSNNLGFALLTGTSVRYRLYTLWGMNPGQIAQIVLFCSVTFFLGLFFMGGLSLIFAMPPLPPDLKLPGWAMYVVDWVGWLAVGTGCVYLALPLFWKKPLVVKGVSLPVPTFGLSFAQLLVAGLDWVAAAAVFYSLLPPTPGLSFFNVLTIFMAGNILGVMAHVPGGIGVFETVATFLLAPFLTPPQILGSLIAYRAVYYLLPFLLALLAFAGYELLQKKHWLEKMTSGFEDGARAIVPPVISMAVFAAGAVLLFSGATPTVHDRIRFLREVMPLPLLEASHFLGSLVGMALLLLARSLQRHYDAAFSLTISLLTAGILFSLMKGLDYEEAVFLALVLVSMLPCRSLFYRKASLLNAPFSNGWLAAIAAVLIGAIWITLFSYRHIEFSNDLWLQFTFRGDASRALRAGVGVAGLSILVGIAHLLRPAPVKPHPPTRDELADAKRLVALSPLSQASLALAGDKYLLFNSERTAFLMYGIEGRSWVVLGDPIGPEKAVEELLWDFRELCDVYDAWPVFYQVRPEYLPRYLELGLSPLKLGEEARIRLSGFSLEGSAMKSLRQSHNKALRDELRFMLIAPEDLPPLMPQLQRISEAWLTEKNTREKGFSIGRFDEAYLENFPMALVYHQERIVGFANVWANDVREELSLDLMRYLPDAPGGVMDFLMVELMLWGKSEGYRWFNLGMAPMSGLVEHPLAPLWNKIALTLYAHGTRFYNFQGLRQYKEKFNPQWEPRYLVSRGGMQLPRILANVTALISRGMLGSVKR